MIKPVTQEEAAKATATKLNTETSHAVTLCIDLFILAQIDVTTQHRSPVQPHPSYTSHF